MKVKGQYTMLNTKQQEFVDHAVKKFGSNELTVSQLKEANKHFGNKYAPQWLIKNADYKVGKSLFKLPTENDVVTSKSSGESEKVLTTKAPETETVSEAAYVVSSLTGDIVPKKDPVFVSFGNYPDVKSINSSFPYAFSSSMGVQLATPFLSIKFISLQTYSHVRSALKVHDAFT